MARQIYKVINAVRPTTAAPVKQSCPAATARTMLQVASLANQGLQVLSWGLSWDASAAATPPVVEIFGTTVAVTGMTALAAADVQCPTDENAPASDSLLQFGAALTGFVPTAGGHTEGTVANYRLFEVHQIPPTGPSIVEYSLGNEAMIDASQFVRFRVTSPAAYGMYCWLNVARL